MTNFTEVVIIGGGPIGIACALEAQKRGLSHRILEKGTIVNSLFNYPKNMQFFSSSEKLEIGGVPFISKEAKPKRDEALEYYRRIVTSNQLNIHLFEKVTSVTGSEGHFSITTNKSVYTAAFVIVATGFYDIPSVLNVPGEDLPKVSHYYKDPHYYAMQDLAVIGASNSAVDAALECYRKGARVTMIIRGEDVGTRVKYWVRPDIKNRIEEGSIKAFFNSTVKEITEHSVLFEQHGKTHEIPNDFVLALTGYQPNFEFLVKMGVHLSADGKNYPEYNEDSMETNVNGLFLAGVICGGMDTHLWFIENSRVHAQKIMSAITERSRANT